MALQLVQFRNSSRIGESPSSLQVKLETLQTLLNAVGSRPISVISICGPANLGKSFLLNYILRCLGAAEKGAPDWLERGNPKKPLHGFRWQTHESCSSLFDTVTKGICVWSKPFILKNARGKEFAVLVLDTQGVYDSFSPNSDNKAMIGLCMLLSSVTILNLPSDSDTIVEVLKSLKVFCEYGNMVMGEYVEKPFEKLSMLVRDWNDSPKYPLGKEGGRKYLKSKLRLGDKNQNMVDRQIRNYFAHIDCFLMPDRGATAKFPNYDGNFAGLSKSFKVRLEEYVSNLVENDVRVRNIGGNVLSSRNFVDFLNVYVDMFNKPVFPSAEVMFMTTCCIQDNLIEESLEKYRKSFGNMIDGQQYLSEGAFEDAHKEGERQATKYLTENMKSVQSHAQESPVGKLLASLVNREREMMKSKNDDKRMKALANAELAALEVFRVQFIEKYAGKAVQDEKFLSMQGVIAESVAYTEFLNRLCGNESVNELRDLWHPIRTQIESTVSSVMEKRKDNVKEKQPKGKGKKQGVKVDKDADCFNCPICFEVPPGKVFQCKNGHIICEKCCESVKQCPQCRVYLTGAGSFRNRAMEEILAKLRLAK